MSADSQFVQQLRETTERYLRAVDAWESEYAKYYRLPVPGQVSPDLAGFHEIYLNTRKELQRLLPEATRLCRRFGFRDVWQSILRVELGAGTPQAGSGTGAIGRGERREIDKCLDQLEEAVAAPSSGLRTAGPAAPSRRRGLLGWIHEQLF